MNDNVLTSYSFLAALSENETDIYKTVYLPLFKRAISSYAAKKSSKESNSIQGTDIDIQSIILEEYGIEVPILIVRKLIKKQIIIYVIILLSVLCCSIFAGVKVAQLYKVGETKNKSSKDT